MAKKIEQPQAEQPDLELPEFSESNPAAFDVVSLAEKLFVKHWNRPGQQTVTTSGLIDECLESAEMFGRAVEARSQLKQLKIVADVG